MTRPIIDDDLTRLTVSLARLRQLAHVDATRVLYVAGAARLTARASIRPFAYRDPPEAGWKKPIVEIAGVRMLYEVCLRPRFFLEASPEERLSIVAHELWHCSEDFDGTLAEDRRHHGGAVDPIAHAVAEMLEGFDDSEATRFLGALDPEARMRAWRVRPPSRIPLGSGVRDRYDERDLFLAVVGGK